MRRWCVMLLGMLGFSSFLFQSAFASGLDFWPDFLNQLQFTHDDARPQVQYFIRQDAGRLDIIQSELDHAQYTLPYVVKTLRARQMPVDLALLPFIESGYLPSAQSDVGATGIWQLMPITARSYGYDVENPWVDPMNNIVLSTQIAMDNLAELHREFGGWYLALAAYNAGPGTVMGVIRLAADRHESLNYWNLALPYQTRDYVPRLLAMSYILRHAAAFHLRLPPITLYNRAVLITLPKQLSIQQIIRDAQIPVGLFEYLNPGFSRDYTPPWRTQILLPPVNVWAFDHDYYRE